MVEETLLVNGQWRASAAGFEVLDPATGDVVGIAADADDATAREMVEAAATAFQHWRKVDPETRGGYLREAARVIRERAGELAELIVRENGKIRVQAIAEVNSSARMLEWAAEEGRRAYGRVTPHNGEGPGFVLTAPVGPTLAISPWNYPMSMITRKVGLALAAGCTVIAKPAKKSPFTSALTIRILQEAGLPAGVLQHITSESASRVTNAILADARIRKVTFTGSTGVGHQLLRADEAIARRYSLELGGHAPAIVFRDADLDNAAASIQQVKFVNSGQICIAINRLYVHRSVVGPLIERLKSRAEALVLGHGLDEQVTMGPVIDAEALDKVESHVEDAVAKGATIVTGGHRWQPDREELTGAFFEPTILTDVTSAMRITQEETFGPVLAIVVFDDDAEAIELANDSEFGLAAYVFARDLTRIWTALTELEFGVIGVNDPFIVRPELPFGGLKNSGQEREGGIEGIESYLELRAVAMKLLPTPEGE